MEQMKKQNQAQRLEQNNQQLGVTLALFKQVKYLFADAFGTGEGDCQPPAKRNKRTILIQIAIIIAIVLPAIVLLHCVLSPDRWLRI